MNAQLPLYIRPGQVPALFGISRSTLYRLAADGQITIHRRGQLSFVRVAEIDDYIRGKGGCVGERKRTAGHS